MIYRLFLVLALLLATSPAHAGYFGPAVASVTPTAPNAPTSVSASVASATSATITWTNSTIGYPAPTYDLYRGTSSGTETLWQSSVTSPYTATGLTTDQIYWFYLKATNSAGTSAASNEVSVTPSAAITAPGAPTGVTATAGNAQATVTFSAPASNGGSAITGYTVTSSPAGGTDSNAGSTSLSHVVTGLTNGTAYTFTVTATNTAGTSAASSASNSVTPAAVTYIADAEFASGTLDSGFTAVTSGTGSVTSNSPTGYATVNANGNNSTAMIIKSTALPSNKVFTVTVKYKVSSSANGAMEVSLYDLASAPASMTSTAANAAVRANIQLAGVFNKWLIQYQNGSATYYRLSSSNVWQTATAWQDGVTVGTEYLAILSSDGTTLTMALKSADGATTIASGSIAWSSIKAVSNSLWLAVGQPQNDGGTGCTGTFDYIRIQ